MLAPYTLSHRHAIFGLWMSLSACLSLPRARGGRRRLSKVFRAFQPSWLADDFRRGVRHQFSSLARLDGETVDRVVSVARKRRRMVDRVVAVARGRTIPNQRSP